MRRLLGVLGGQRAGSPLEKRAITIGCTCRRRGCNSMVSPMVMWLTSVAHAASVSSLPHTRSREDTDRAGAYSDSKSETTTAERVADFGWENGKLEPGIALAMLSGRLLHAR